MSVLVGRKAPVFRAEAVINGNEIVESFSLEQYRDKKYVLLFFYPADFTFVCPTEILAFQEYLPQFQDRDVEVVGCSGDSAVVHLKWMQTPVSEGGIAGVTYPMVADPAKVIAQNYDVMAGDYVYGDTGEVAFLGPAVAYRASFLIDKKGIVRHQLVNDLPLGRSMDEAIRMIDALQHYEQNGELCPINWQKGQEGIVVK